MSETENLIHSEALLNALEQNPWKTYIQVLAENGKVAIEEIDQHLDPKKGIQKTIEITGIGGLGKTSVAREYMKRCINGRYRKNEPYTFYFYYTAKGAMGEVETRYGDHSFIQSSGWKQGGGLYVPQLNFNQFLSKICTSLNLKVDIETLSEYLRENPVLIVLDNFEDVDLENKKRYTDFLQRIRVSATQSRVIITSRKRQEFKDEAHEVSLRELEGAKGTLLIYERYKFLAREYYLSDERRKKRSTIDKKAETLHQNYTRVTKFLEPYVNKNSTRTEGNSDDVVADLLKQLDKQHQEDVMLNLRHPIMLMRIAALLNSALVEDVLKSGRAASESSENIILTDNRSILDILVAILTLPEYGFLEYQRNVIRYIINKAWDSILKEELCKEILNVLYQQPDSKISVNELRQRLVKLTGEEGPIVDRMERAITKIRKHSVFLVEEENEEDEDYIQLLDSARSTLATVLQDGAKEGQIHPTKPKTIDLVERLKTKQSVNNWDEFEPLVEIFCQIVAQPDFNNALGEEKLAEIEDALFSKLTEAKISKPIEENMAAALRFISHANDRGRGIQFTIEKLETLIQSFPTLDQASLEFLSANWFDGQNRLEEKAQITQLNIVTLLLSHGVQQRLNSLSQLFIKLIIETPNQDIIAAFSTLDERIMLGELMSRYANLTDWNKDTQELFVEFDVVLDQSDRFRVGMVGDYKTMEILHHRESETTGGLETNTCYVCDYDLKANRVMLYVCKPNEPKVNALSIKKRSNEFNRWLSNPQTGHPGLSAEVETLAADILAVHDYYNETFLTSNAMLLGRGPFSTAAKLKKNFHAYHTSQHSATSVAFIVGYHCEMKPMSVKQMQKMMKREVSRRLKKFPQPNIYFKSEELKSWNDFFVHLVDQAVECISEQPEKIRNIMMGRMRKDQDFQKSNSEKIKKQLRQKLTPIAQEGQLEIPKALADYVIYMADKPILSKERLKTELIKRAGGELIYNSGKKHHNRGDLTEGYLNLPYAWIQTILKVILSKPLSKNLSRYTQKETVEILKEILDSHQ